MNSINHVSSLLHLIEHHLCEMQDEVMDELETKKGKQEGTKLVDEMLSHVEAISKRLDKVNKLD